MTTADKPSPPSQGSVINYAEPQPAGPHRGTRHRFKHIVAIVFAAIAVMLGALLASNALGYYQRSLAEPTTIDQRRFLWDAIQLLGCSVVLVVPGIWYGRIGIRGEPSEHRA